MTKFSRKFWNEVKQVYLDTGYGVDRLMRELKKRGYNKLPARHTINIHITKEGWVNDKKNLRKKATENIINALAKQKAEDFKIRRAMRAAYLQALKDKDIIPTGADVINAMKLDMTERGEVTDRTELSGSGKPITHEDFSKIYNELHTKKRDKK